MTDKLTQRNRSILIILTTLGLLGGIVTMLWYQDWQYALPTPKPKALRQPPAGDRIALPQAILAASRHKRPLPILLNFLNVNCPCTRFNLDHLRDLIATYSGKVRFVAVLEDEDPEKRREEFPNLHLDAQSYADDGGALAKACGVYSTPQAVLLTPEGNLYYRGNYNASRYCTNPASAFTRHAVDALLAGQSLPNFGPAASRAYGCLLPSYTAHR